MVLIDMFYVQYLETQFLIIYFIIMICEEWFRLLQDDNANLVNNCKLLDWAGSEHIVDEGSIIYPN